MSYDNGGMSPQEARDMDMDNMRSACDYLRTEIAVLEQKNQILEDKLKRAYERLDDVARVLEKTTLSPIQRATSSIPADIRVMGYREE